VLLIEMMNIVSLDEEGTKKKRRRIRMEISDSSEEGRPGILYDS
jgi:hypothetical protein